MKKFQQTKPCGFATHDTCVTAVYAGSSLCSSLTGWVSVCCADSVTLMDRGRVSDVSSFVSSLLPSPLPFHALIVHACARKCELSYRESVSPFPFFVCMNGFCPNRLSASDSSFLRPFFLDFVLSHLIWVSLSFPLSSCS